MFGALESTTITPNASSSSGTARRPRAAPTKAKIRNATPAIVRTMVVTRLPPRKSMTTNATAAISVLSAHWVSTCAPRSSTTTGPSSAVKAAATGNRIALRRPSRSGVVTDARSDVAAFRRERRRAASASQPPAISATSATVPG
jgi:hypothetical protein